MIMLRVYNDGTHGGDPLLGSYDIVLDLPREKLVARVENFRRSHGWAELLRQALDELEAAEIGEMVTE